MRPRKGAGCPNTHGFFTQASACAVRFVMPAPVEDTAAPQAQAAGCPHRRQRQGRTDPGRVRQRDHRGGGGHRAAALERSGRARVARRAWAAWSAPAVRQIRRPPGGRHLRHLSSAAIARRTTRLSCRPLVRREYARVDGGRNNGVARRPPDRAAGAADQATGSRGEARAVATRATVASHPL